MGGAFFWGNTVPKFSIMAVSLVPDGPEPISDPVAVYGLREIPRDPVTRVTPIGSYNGSPGGSSFDDPVLDSSLEMTQMAKCQIT